MLWSCDRSPLLILRQPHEWREEMLLFPFQDPLLLPMLFSLAKYLQAPCPDGGERPLSVTRKSTSFHKELGGTGKQEIRFFFLISILLWNWKVMHYTPGILTKMYSLHIPFPHPHGWASCPSFRGQTLQILELEYLENSSLDYNSRHKIKCDRAGINAYCFFLI